MLSEDKIKEFVMTCEGLTNKVREVFDQQDFPVIMAVLGKIVGEMIYEMQITPNDEEAIEHMERFASSVKLAYAIVKEHEEQLPEGGVTH